MSIEKLIKEQTEALAANTAAINALINKVNIIEQAAGLAIEETGIDTPAAPAPAPAPAAPAPAAPAPAPAPAPAAPAAPAMTPEELNNALVVEFRRLGSREGIDQAMAEFGVTSVNDLKPEQFQQLLDKVKAI